MIKLENVSKTYQTRRGEVRALQEANLTVQPGELVLVRGVSGSGKSTLLLTIGGMHRPSAGRVEVDGQDIFKLNPQGRAAFRRQHIGFVFQTFHLVPYLSAVDNVLLAAVNANGDKDAVRDRATTLLSDFGLASRLDHRPASLSVGERQRTAVARAMLNEPKVILADEPTGNLDSENANQVFALLKSFTQAGGCVVAVTHSDHHDAIADRVLTLKEGQIQDA